MNRQYIILLCRPIKHYLDRSMMIRKSRPCLVEIENYIGCLGRSLVGDLERHLQASAHHVGQLFKVILKRWLLKRLHKKVLQFVYKKKESVNTKGKQYFLI